MFVALKKPAARGIPGRLVKVRWGEMVPQNQEVGTSLMVLRMREAIE